MLLYYITDRMHFAGNEEQRRTRLLDRIAQAAAAGIDLIQLREKDLSAHELAQLATEALRQVEAHGRVTKLLINSRLDVALSVGAHGLHLTSNDITLADVRGIVKAATADRAALPDFIVGVSCHSLPEVRLAGEHGADFVVLAPIFEKVLELQTDRPGEDSPQRVQPKQAGIGLDALRQAAGSGGGAKVVALGGVNLGNAGACIAAGASGVAGIRLFQQGELQETVRRLRSLPV